MSFDAGGLTMPDYDRTTDAGDTPEAGRGGRERRATYRALAYWEMLCAGGEVPSGGLLDADAPPDLRQSLFVVSIRRPAESSVIAQGGAALDALCGGPATGRRLDEAMPYALRDTFGDLTRVIDQYRKPVLNSGMTQAGDGSTVLYRSILMPLGNADGRVTGILGAIGCRPVPSSI